MQDKSLCNVYEQYALELQKQWRIPKASIM